MQEIWKPLPWFLIPLTNDPMYKISNKWDIMNCRNKYTYNIPHYINASGYSYFQFYTNSKRYTFTVHKAVMLAFIGERPEWLDIDHLDGNKQNNHLSNLEYVPHKINIQRSFAHWTHVALKWSYHHFYNKTWALHPKSKAIIQKNLNGDILHTYESLMSGAEAVGWNRSHISAAIKHNKTAYWFIWIKVNA